MLLWGGGEAKAIVVTLNFVFAVPRFFFASIFTVGGLVWGGQVVDWLLVVLRLPPLPLFRLV